MSSFEGKAKSYCFPTLIIGPKRLTPPFRSIRFKTMFNQTRLEFCLKFGLAPLGIFFSPDQPSSQWKSLLLLKVMALRHSIKMCCKHLLSDAWLAIRYNSSISPRCSVRLRHVLNHRHVTVNQPNSFHVTHLTHAIVTASSGALEGRYCSLTMRWRGMKTCCKKQEKDQV